MSDGSDDRFVFGPAQRPTLIGGLRHAQVAFGVIGISSAVCALRFGSGQVAVVVAATLLTVGTAAAFATINGRPIDDWIPAAARWATTVGLQRRNWRSPAPPAGRRTDGNGRPVPPPTLAHWKLIKATISGAPMGIMANHRTKTWVAVLKVSGQSFMLLDKAAKTRRLAAWAGVEAAMARHGSPVARFQWIERTVPEPGDEMEAFFNEHAASDLPSPVQSYRQLLEDAQPVTQQHETFLAIAVTGASGGRAMRSAGGGDRGAAAVLYRQLGHLEHQLREADLTVEGFLSPDALTVALRAQFDPSATQAGTVSVQGVWPTATEACWAAYRTDDTHHVTYWVAQWPRLGAGPDFLSPLLLGSGDITRTVSVVAEPIPTVKALREVEHAQTSRLADEDLRQRAGYRASATRRRETEALERREHELADGHAECRYTGYVTVTAPTRSAVEEAASAIEQLAYQCPLELKRLWGEQDTAFTTTLPLTLGLST